MFSSCLKQGWVEVIVGSMFSGKSEELIRRIKRTKLAKQKVIVFKHSLDKRYMKEEIVSHSGYFEDAILASSAKDIEEVLKDNKNIDVVAIDEIQFFGADVLKLVDRLANSGIRVIVAGLDQDFKAEPFGEVPNYMAMAEVVTKLNAICSQCGAPASRTQRIVNGRPAKASDPIVLVGASEYYEARCRKCHKVD